MKEFLSQRGVQYAEKYVDTDRSAAVEMIRRSGQQGVPVTVIGGEIIVGFDRSRLERALALMKGHVAQTSTSSKRKSLGAKVADAGGRTLQGGLTITGALVGGVNAGSPAEAAGLRIGDVIIKVGNTPIHSVDDLAAALSAAPNGSISLSVRRGANVRELTANLGK